MRGLSALPTGGVCEKLPLCPPDAPPSSVSYAATRSHRHLKAAHAKLCHREEALRADVAIPHAPSSTSRSREDASSADWENAQPDFHRGRRAEPLLQAEAYRLFHEDDDGDQPPPLESGTGFDPATFRCAADVLPKAPPAHIGRIFTGTDSEGSGTSTSVMTHQSFEKEARTSCLAGTAGFEPAYLGPNPMPLPLGDIPVSFAPRRGYHPSPGHFPSFRAVSKTKKGRNPAPCKTRPWSR